MIEFSNNWFQARTQPIWEKHVLPYADQVDSYLELGVAEGRSMRWILENLKPSTAVGVDHWKDARGKQDDVFRKYKDTCFENLAEWINKACFLHEGTSLEFLASCIVNASHLLDEWDISRTPDQFDLIYIDGDHSANGAMTDMMLAYQLLAQNTWELELSTVDRRGKVGTKNKAGGIMIVDDIHRLFGRNGKPQVGTAIPAFESVMYGRIHRLWKDGRQVCYTRID